MKRLPWPWIVATLLVMGGLSVVALLAHTDPHYPAAFGFQGTRDQWQLFWITFWSTSFPTIATAALITLLAGRYLNDRERRLDQREDERLDRQRAREGIDILRQTLRRVVTQPDNADIFTSLSQNAPPSAKLAWQPVGATALTLWRPLLRDAGTTAFFALVDQLEASRVLYERAAFRLDGSLMTAVHEVGSAYRMGRPVPLTATGQVWIDCPDEIVKAYAIGQIIPVNHAHVVATVEGMIPNSAFTLATMWSDISMMGNMSMHTTEYREARARVKNAVQAMAASLSAAPIER